MAQNIDCAKSNPRSMLKDNGVTPNCHNIQILMR